MRPLSFKAVFGESWAKLPRWRRRTLFVLSVNGCLLLLICLISCIWAMENDLDRGNFAIDHFNLLYDFDNGMLYLRWYPEGLTFQRKHPDEWRIILLGVGVRFSGTYHPPNAIVLHGIFYDAHFPVWVPAALLLLCPIIWCESVYSRFERARRGHCVECDYDLRGIVDVANAVCPECGRSAAFPTSVAMLTGSSIEADRLG